MPLSVAAHHAMLDHLGSLATLVGLCEATTLAANVTAGAATVDVTHLVEVGDWISLDDGTREEHEVTAVSGTGPYTATLDEVTQFAHGVNTDVGHAPKAATALREADGPSYARQSLTWNPASGENLNTANAPEFQVEGGTAIGGYLFADGSTYYGAFLTDGIEVFGAAGTCQITDADVSAQS